MHTDSHFLTRCTPILVCIFCLLHTGCVKNRLNERLREHEKSQAEARHELSSPAFSQDATPIQWEKAVELALENNIQYKNSQYSHKEIRKQRVKLFTNMAPKLFTFLNINSSIAEISDISSDDINVSFNSSLNIPNPISLYSQLYGIALQEIQSELNIELQRRQLITRLYSLHDRSTEISMRSKELAVQEKQLEHTPIHSIPQAIESIERKRLNIAQQRESLRLRLNSLFNTPGKHWKIVGDTPDISYANKLEQLDFAQGYGQLGLKLQTTQIETQLLSLWGVKVARFPRISVGVNSPQLYSSERDDNFQLSPEDFSLFTGLSKTINLDDILDKENLRKAERRATASRHQLRLTMESELSRLKTNKFTYRARLKKRALLEKQRKSLLHSSKSNSITQLSDDLKTLSSLDSSIQSIDRQLHQLDLQLVIWDDNFWKNN